MSRPWDVTVVIPARGYPGPLQELLAALSHQGEPERPLPVIVVDDASTPPIEAVLADATYPGIALHLVRRAKNGGPGAARNTGLDQVTTAWVAFIDADELPGPGWVPRLDVISRRADGPDGVEGPVELPATGPPTPFTHHTEFSGQGDRHLGGNVVYRTDKLRAIGGYDERYYDASRRLHFREDTDLHFRLEAAALDIEFDPSLVIAHPAHPPSFTTPMRLARRYYFDPLLSREHPDAFHAFNAEHRVGPITLRRARHDAALMFAAGLALAGIGMVSRRPAVVRVGAAVSVVGWGANAAALAWRRRVRPQDIAPLAAASAATPLVYLWHHTRGIIKFGHKPRY
jgi:glycosyltransferase involved in cell wall biosynthesis